MPLFLKRYPYMNIPRSECEAVSYVEVTKENGRTGFTPLESLNQIKDAKRCSECGKGREFDEEISGDSAIVCAVVPTPQDEKGEKRRGIAFVISSPEKQFFNDKVSSFHTVTQGLTSL